MSLDSEPIISKYINKVMAIQESRNNHLRPLSSDDMEWIAEELKLSEEDKKVIEEEFQGHLNRGLGFLRHKNWTTAIKELDQALTLKPYHKGTIICLAAANQKLFYSTKKESFREEAIEYAQKCLIIDSKNEDAFRIITEMESINRKKKPSKFRKALFWILIFTVIVAVVLIVISTGGQAAIIGGQALKVIRPVAFVLLILVGFFLLIQGL